MANRCSSRQPTPHRRRGHAAHEGPVKTKRKVVAWNEQLEQLRLEPKPESDRVAQEVEVRHVQCGEAEE